VLFNSLTFLIFLPSVLLLYFLLPHRWRWILLLLASYAFYGYWKLSYLSLIITSTVVDYFAAQGIHRSTKQQAKRAWLALSLFANVGLLMAFKYAGWFVEDVAFPFLSEDQVSRFTAFWDFALPVGISFYTFQTIGYTLDVYYGKAKPEGNPFKFALFVSFFPQLVAGPIERFTSLHPQLFQAQRFSYRNLQRGGRLVLYGLFIKMCIADNLAPIVDQIFRASDAASQMQLISGALLFGLQIYSDFHGYSLIAIGTAQLFGIKLMDNFNAPYTATSIRQFWSRWHISLSTWFRDYLYIPLGGNKVGQAKLAMNILIVFLVSGLWHGANWTFVVWGGMHGLAYLMERWFIGRDTSYWLNFPKWLGTMIIVFTAWIFFRSETLTDASLYINNMITGSASALVLEWDPVLIALVGLFILSDLHFRDRGFDAWLNEKSGFIRWSVYGLLIYCITTLSGAVQHPFIYFQF
jgi:D-alanyl-lipoteichoic acid acyltransferase DltB (MBOAT superfamily)